MKRLFYILVISLLLAGCASRSISLVPSSNMGNPHYVEGAPFFTSVNNISKVHLAIANICSRKNLEARVIIVKPESVPEFTFLVDKIYAEATLEDGTIEKVSVYEPFSYAKMKAANTASDNYTYNPNDGLILGGIKKDNAINEAMNAAHPKQYGLLCNETLSGYESQSVNGTLVFTPIPSKTKTLKVTIPIADSKPHTFIYNVSDK